MSAEELVIAAARIVGSLPVLWWPFWGGVFAVLVDQSDLLMMNLLDLGGVSNYQAFDKWLDQVYMLFFLVVAVRWPDPVRALALGLYAFRIVGFVAFEATGTREVLVVFPNLFESWFLFAAFFTPRRPGLGAAVDSSTAEGGQQAGWWDGAVRGRGAFGLSFRYTRRNILIALTVLLALKEAQELAVHWFKVFDSFTTVEAIEAVWRWLGF